jgi:hypothetical protein
LGTVSPKPIAIFLMALACAFLAANKDLIGLLILLGSCGIAHLYIMRLKSAGDVSFGAFFGRFSVGRRPKKPRLVVLPPPKRREIPKVEMAEEPVSEVDELLDKIAKSGMASLTPAERARLEKAREELLKKERQ